ncbi:MAG: restriction endonuclease, partial [Pseudomonadales bacterium]
NSAVPKEKVLVLRSVVEDVGADRGILISAAGFQSGAVRACEKTNITLTDLEGLTETAQEDLVSSLLHRIETKAVELKYAFHNLFSDNQISPHSWELKPRSGVDCRAVMQTIGKLAVLEIGFDRVRLNKPPYPVKFDDAGQRVVATDTLDEFVTQANNVISEAESTLKSQQSGPS